MTIDFTLPYILAKLSLFKKKAKILSDDIDEIEKMLNEYLEQRAQRPETKERR